MTTKALMILLLFFSASAVALRADCKSDCQEEYESKVESCKALHQDPDEADDLERCTQKAKEEYDACVEECDD